VHLNAAEVMQSNTGIESFCVGDAVESRPHAQRLVVACYDRACS
jgi:hypothetical protein